MNTWSILYILLACLNFVYVTAGKIFSEQNCDWMQGDCLTDESVKERCEKNCSRTPPGCLFRVDRFGTGLKYQCHCFDIGDCDFDNDGYCNGTKCFFGHSGPTCLYYESFATAVKSYKERYLRHRRATCQPIPKRILFPHVFRINWVKFNISPAENIALGRPAFQSSDFEVNFLDGDNLCSSKYLATASFAVDGKYNQNFQHKSCSRTKEKPSKSYWYVKLDRNYTINQIRIYTHSFFLYSLNVFVGDKNNPCSQLCYKSKSTESILYISCQRPLVGESVCIQTAKKYASLSLCEVEVIQCREGFYGSFCQHQCDQSSGNCTLGTHQKNDSNTFQEPTNGVTSSSNLTIGVIVGVFLAVGVGVAVADIWRLWM
ncbi:uncharacterized protein LOC106871222 [Octopus bimaculoides]|uniref:uncharacterized protein LOC106871222 n=1 Tax=Octopus bimaculoides TaxID=37653 RepID=UPI00071D7BA8|nr:uncharacterized protein LOC106871222 [Octopus bimaculoides]|eukprot:XP_014773059.1 PREDICTED: uncharacterized protein LOC106871222 [Octopus bimaculoides]